MRKKLAISCAFLGALLASAAPAAWGQRIRFAQSATTTDVATEKDDEGEPSSTVAQPRSIRTVQTTQDRRPAAPSVARSGVVSTAQHSPATIPPYLLPGEVIETPPPYFMEGDPAFPLHDAPMYGAPCGPDCYSLFPNRPQLSLGAFSPFRWGQGFSWGSRLGVFGEFLYLRPRNAEIALAVPGQTPIIVAGNPNVAVPQGRTVLLDPDYSEGFRAGVNVRLNDCTGFQVAYTSWDSDTANGRTLSNTEIMQNIALFPLLLHPRTTLPNNATNVSTEGRLDLEFEIIDADARMALWRSAAVTVNGYVGARWAELDQALTATYSINTGTVVEAATEFEGAGARFGLDGQGALGPWGLGVYGRSELSLLYGYSRAEFNQFPLNNEANPQAFTDWQAGRIAPVYEFEWGLQWASPRQRLRVSAGYMMSVWFNVVTVEDYLQSVQQNEFDDLGDTITFDGLTARVELRL